MRGTILTIYLGGILLVCMTACRLSYTFSQSNIDYEVTKTISISDFPNHATLISPMLSSTFSETLKDKYIRQTRLELVNNNGDLEVEGEITGYNLAPMAVSEDAYSSRTKLTITIRIRYYNRANPDKDFEQTFSAFQDFDSNTMLTAAVQEEIDREIVEELVDLIYNATVADW